MKYSEISIEDIWSLQLQQRCFWFDLVKYWYFISKLILGILKIFALAGCGWEAERGEKEVEGRGGENQNGDGTPGWLNSKWQDINEEKTIFGICDFIKILLRISNCILQLETVHRELKLAKLEAERERFFFKPFEIWLYCWNFDFSWSIV